MVVLRTVIRVSDLDSSAYSSTKNADSDDVGHGLGFTIVIPGVHYYSR